MSTVTVVPTVEANNVPPRVKLDVTDTGSPNLFAATITRNDPSGLIQTVRTNDGNPLTLTTSGANRIGTVYDYEMPYGAPVSYSSIESPTVISADVTVPETDVWLIHPGVPSLSMPVELRAGSFDEEEYEVRQGIFYPMGRQYPVVQSDGARKSAQSSITVAIDNLVDLATLKALIADAGVLLINVPYTLGWGVDPMYAAVGAVRNRRIVDIGSDPHRAVEMPFIVVDRPVGGTQAARTYVDLLDYSTYASLQAAYGSYTALLAGP